MRILLTVLLLAVLLSGCHLTDWDVFPPSGSTGSTDGSGAPTDSTGTLPIDPEAPYADGWCFTRLSETLRQDYAALYTAVEEAAAAADGEVTVDDRRYTGVRVELPAALRGREEAQRLYVAFTTDNPQFFFLSNLYSYEGYRADDTDYYTAFCLVFNMTRSERMQAAAKLERAVGELLAQLPANSGEYETELFFHDRLLALCTYENGLNTAADPVKSFPRAFSAYGALVEGRAGCEGYARAMQLLLHRREMACTLVSGYAAGQSGGSQGHMWNLVRVQGRGYHLDVTWDDSDDLPRHTYFNLTTEEIGRTHQMDSRSLNIGVDTCTATADNYYRREGLYLDTYAPAEIAAVIAHGIAQGWETVELRFPAEKLPSARLLVSDADRLASYVEPLLPAGTGFWMRYYSYVDEDYGTILLQGDD